LLDELEKLYELYELLCYIYGMVAVNFTRKKVESLTLGEKLRKIRSEHCMSLAEASKATKIQGKYLEALESGSYEKLPPEVYVRGFLKGYAAFLGIPEEATLRMYERERSIQKHLGKSEPFRFQPRSPIRFRMDFSSRSVVVGLVVLVVIGFFSYISLEFRSFISEPRLVIVQPVDGSIIDSPELVVSGETEYRALVQINGEEATVGEDGGFAERVTLKPGLNVVSVSAVNRFGKERQRSISVSANIPEQIATPIVSGAATIPEMVMISIRMAEAASVTVKADGSTVFSGRLVAGETREFEAKEELLVSSGNGSAVIVRSGGGAEEPLSENIDPAERIFRSAISSESQGGITNQ